MWPQFPHLSNEALESNHLQSLGSLSSFQLVTIFLVRGLYILGCCHTAASASIDVGSGHRPALADTLLANVTEPPLRRSFKNHPVVQ